jgi:hypothetical protein
MSSLPLDDLSQFFDGDEFAVPAQWVAEGVTHEALVHFKAPSRLLSIGHNRPVIEEPTLLGQAQAMAPLTEGDAVTVAGHTYRVTAVMPDGYGLVRMTLSEVLSNALGDYEAWQ